MTVKTNIAAGLKKARKNAGLNVDEVGLALGKSGKTISAWEVGRGQPDGDELIVLCKLLGAHLRDFYGEEFDDYLTEQQPEGSLCADEVRLLSLYQSMSDSDRRLFLEVAEVFAGSRSDGGAFEHQ